MERRRGSGQADRAVRRPRQCGSFRFLLVSGLLAALAALPPVAMAGADAPPPQAEGEQEIPGRPVQVTATAVVDFQQLTENPVPDPGPTGRVIPFMPHPEEP